nr:MAG TPA: hypothetical protein [Caudoviricetes sp.]
MRHDFSDWICKVRHQQTQHFSDRRRLACEADHKWLGKNLQSMH